MGFAYKLPHNLHLVLNPTEPNAIVVDENDTDSTEDSDDESTSYGNNHFNGKIEEAIGDDLDIEVFASEEEYLEWQAQSTSRQAQEELEQIKTADNAE
jgi:hypothetical protein